MIILITLHVPSLHTAFVRADTLIPSAGDEFRAAIGKCVSRSSVLCSFAQHLLAFLLF